MKSHQHVSIMQKSQMLHQQHWFFPVLVCITVQKNKVQEESLHYIIHSPAERKTSKAKRLIVEEKSSVSLKNLQWEVGTVIVYLRCIDIPRN